jgi:hypothetical protein
MMGALRRLSFGFGAFLWVGACGGTSSAPPPPARSDASAVDGASDSFAQDGARGDDQGDADTRADAPPPDAGPCLASSAGHRPQDVCPSHDTDGAVLDAGPGPCGQGLVPHDACLTDADCGPGSACVCQTPGVQGCGVPPTYGNACVPSNCRTGADCSPCAVCREQYVCGKVTGYFCATPGDECAGDSDCPSAEPGACQYQNGRWSCQSVGCPG